MTDLRDTTRHSESYCWNCKTKLDASTGEGAPADGDWTVCIRCGCLSVYRDDLTLREPTVDELVESTKNEDIQRFRRAILQL